MYTIIMLTISLRVVTIRLKMSNYYVSLTSRCLSNSYFLVDCLLHRDLLHWQGIQSIRMTDFERRAVLGELGIRDVQAIANRITNIDGEVVTFHRYSHVHVDLHC